MRFFFSKVLDNPYERVSYSTPKVSKPTGWELLLCSGWLPQLDIVLYFKEIIIYKLETMCHNVVRSFSIGLWAPCLSNKTSWYSLVLPLLPSSLGLFSSAIYTLHSSSFKLIVSYPWSEIEFKYLYLTTIVKLFRCFLLFLWQLYFKQLF